MQNLDHVADDLSAVQADDRLLDYLGSALPAAAGELDDLSTLMLAWRADIDSTGYSDLVDLDTALATIAYATRTWWATNTGLKIAALALFLAVLVAVALALTAAEAGGAA